MTRGMRRKALGLLLLLPLLAAGGSGCAAIAASTPPDWAYFDVVVHPGGGIPANLGYYAGTAIWSPFGFLLGGLLPYPADEAVASKPGEALGTGIGLVLGAPFHLLALPFGASGPPEEPPPETPSREEPKVREEPREAPRPAPGAEPGEGPK